MGNAWILIKKTFSLTLIFNALLSIACASGIIAGFMWFFPDWQPFSPFLVNGNLFWVVIAAAALNVFPCALVGRHLKTGRFLFHHYLYGFLVLLLAAIYIVAFTSVPLHTVFLVNNTSLTVNAGRFFLLGGFTLVLDDLPDVSKRLESALNWLKAKAFRVERLLGVLQLAFGAASLYIAVAVCLAMLTVPEWLSLANFILVFTLFFTAVTAFFFVKKRFWSSIRPLGAPASDMD